MIFKGPDFEKNQHIRNPKQIC